MAITFNYNDKLYINGDNVGIGTDSPSAKLHVESNIVSEPLALFKTSSGDASVRIEGAGGESYLEIANTAVSGSATDSWGIGMNDNTNLSFGWGTNSTLNKTDALVIETGGNVGIGTTSPDYNLDVEKNTNALTGINVGNNNTGVNARADVIATSESASIRMIATSAGYTAVAGWADSGILSTDSGASGGMIFNIQASAPYRWMHSATNERMRIDSAGSTTHIASYSGGTFPFRVGYGTYASFTPTFVIDDTSKVGIGTSSPIGKLTIISEDTTSNPAISIRQTNSDTQGWDFDVENINIGRLDISSVAVGNNKNARISILKASGNVGIGTTSPSGRLHITQGGSSMTQVLIGNTGTGGARTYYDGSNGDFSGNDYMSIGQEEDLSGVIDMAPNAGSFHIQTSSSTRLTVTQAGNVGIGTASPNEKLQVGGNFHVHDEEGNTDAIIAITQGSTNTTTAVIASNGNSYFNGGNVGIGTTSPAEKLEVRGSVYTNSENNGFIVDAGGSSRVGLMKYQGAEGVISRVTGQDFGIVRTATSDIHDGNITYDIYVKGDGNVGIGTTSPTSLLEISQQLSAVSTIDYPYTISSRDDGNTLNQLGGEGVGIKFRIAGNADATPGDSLVGASIAAIRESSGDSDSSTGLGFFITQNDETLDEAVRIDHDGNVGIGTTSPTAKLEVNVASGDGILIKSDDVATIKMKGSGGVYDWGLATTKLAAHDFGIYKSNAAGGDPISAGTVQLYFKETGSTTTNVGIGTRNPSEKLEVDGNIAADGFLGSPETTAVDTGSGYASYDVLTGKTGAGLYQVSIMANPNSAGSSAYKDILYGKVIIGTGWDGSNITHYIHYVQENPDPRGMYTSGGGNLTVEALFVTGGTESTSILNNTTYTVRIKISGYTVAGSGTIVRTQKIV